MKKDTTEIVMRVSMTAPSEDINGRDAMDFVRNVLKKTDLTPRASLRGLDVTTTKVSLLSKTTTYK